LVRRSSVLPRWRRCEVQRRICARSSQKASAFGAFQRCILSSMRRASGAAEFSNCSEALNEVTIRLKVWARSRALAHRGTRGMEH